MSVSVPYVIARRRPNTGGKSRTVLKKTPTCLVLQRIKSLLTFYNLGDIVSHDADGVIYLCLNGSGFGIRPSASTRSRGIGRRATARKVGVIRF